MAASAQDFNVTDFRRQLQEELTGNILPFWMNHAVDHVNGGFYGALTNDLEIHNEVPRSAILCARILWTYATAYRKLGDKEYLAMARWAYDYLTRVFLDPGYGGLYWTVDYLGKPVFDRKHHYAQAFAIYGLSEYYRATGEPQSLTLAQSLFQLLEAHAFDPVYGGYLEGSSRNWEDLADMRLSDRDLNCRKSMNTMLHVLEAYTNLLLVWEDSTLKTQHSYLIEMFQQHIVDHSTGHFKLFFDDQWNSLLDNMSFGHDIEGSWLLFEAAQVQREPALVKQVRETAIQIATAVYKDGLEQDGSLPYEAGPRGLVDSDKSWWVQAEAMVGFYNAYQLSRQARFAQAAWRSWNYIRDKIVDRTHGDWLKRLHRDGTPDNSNYKVGPWECPYHHSRACFEMLDRLDSQ
ncbi:MAG: AGE family epimerase/isomerase [Anaerolineales bacterium]